MMNINELSKLISNEYHTPTDIVKIKTILTSMGFNVECISNELLIQLENKKVVVQFSNDKDNRHFTVGDVELNKLYQEKKANQIDQKYIDEIMDSSNDRVYMTTRNGIDKLLTYNIDDKLILHSSNIDNPKAKLWQNILKREEIDTSKTEHHLVINPKMEHLDEYLLFSIFKDLCAKFYRNYLGKRFNLMKDQQIMVYIVAEYGKLYNLSHIKDVHLHMILKTDNQDMLDKFHSFMEREMRYKTSENMDYQYKLVNTKEYRVNLYNYLNKEPDRPIWSNNELFQRKSEMIYQSKIEPVVMPKPPIIDNNNPLVKALNI